MNLNLLCMCKRSQTKNAQLKIFFLIVKVYPLDLSNLDKGFLQYNLSKPSNFIYLSHVFL